MRFSLKNVFSIFSLKNVFPLLSLFMLIGCSPPLPPIPPPPFAHFDISTLDQFVDFNACPECPRDKIRIRILEDTYNDPDQCPIKKGFLQFGECFVGRFVTGVFQTTSVKQVFQQRPIRRRLHGLVMFLQNFVSLVDQRSAVGCGHARNLTVSGFRSLKKRRDAWAELRSTRKMSALTRLSGRMGKGARPTCQLKIAAKSVRWAGEVWSKASDAWRGSYDGRSLLLGKRLFR